MQLFQSYNSINIIPITPKKPEKKRLLFFRGRVMIDAYKKAVSFISHGFLLSSAVLFCETAVISITSRLSVL